MTVRIATPLSLRAATPDDAAKASELLYETMSSLGDYLFGRPNRIETIRVLAVLFREGRHLLSYQFSTVAEVDGQVVGIVQAMPGADLWKVTYRLVRACRRRFGWRSAVRLAWRGLWLAFEPDAQAGEFYVNTLAVAPDRRNRGVGRALLEAAERRGRELGFPVCSLSVMLQNTDALRFYERGGYRIDRKVLSRLHAAGVQYNGFFRMVKPLDGPGAQGKGAASP